MLHDVALHASLPEMLVDPVGVAYVVGPNYHREVAFDPLGGSWGTATFASREGRWLFLHGVATPAGGWLAWPDPHLGGPVPAVVVRHFRRTGDCATGAVCTTGQTRTCGYCGSQTCAPDGQWESCSGEGECYPETTTECDGVTATCTHECAWDPSCTGGEDGGADGNADGNAEVGDGGADDGAPDSGVPDGPAADADADGGSAPSGGVSGCNCAVPAVGGSGLPPLVGLLLAAGARRPRRPNPRRPAPQPRPLSPSPRSRGRP